MVLDNRQKEIIKNALNDYDFIKNEIESKLNLQNCELEDISRFLGKFSSKDLEITNLEEYDDYGYLDFIYKDLNMFCMFEKEKVLNRVANTFEIYDKEKMEYIIEDFITKEEYEKMLKRTREEDLQELVANLKYYESNNMNNSYENELQRIIVFLKENW